MSHLLHLHRVSLPQSSLRFRFPRPIHRHRRRAALSLTNLTKSTTVFLPITVSRSRITSCRFSQSDITRPQYDDELSKEAKEDKQKPQKQGGANGIFWIILINLGIYVADHFFQVRGIKSLYLYHNFPAWYQFVTATFCHANWKHLSSNLFFLYIFGKLVEEEEGNFGLWLSYLFTGVGANLVSWLVLPRNAVSVGASGAVFGLFAISVLVKMSWDWRKILEVLILGQFVIERVMEAAQASAGLSGTIYGGYSLQTVNHIAHLSGALVGVVLVWLLSKFPSEPVDHQVKKSPLK
ncbi:PREDICTED: rhomboid-like protein 11, chloroplastic [Camelina sativa]|uniref:Rhomboid-like protein 11, chloroplastic n=1 Tax=Camelina sativa TaxID=90675 RepID=A0ABM0T641_CAMSA|nr:PREDICTED: rhomboid-like protein 11, chloroplastic [Camelina sativa]